MFQYTFGTSVGMEEERGENTNNNGHVKAILFNAKKGIRAAMVQKKMHHASRKMSLTKVG